MGLGAIFVNQLVKYDEKLKEDLDKMLDKAQAANERRYFGSPLSSFLLLPFSPLLLLFLSQPPIWPYVSATSDSENLIPILLLILRNGSGCKRLGAPCHLNVCEKERLCGRW